MFFLCMLVVIVYTVPYTHSVPHGEELHRICEELFVRLDVNRNGNIEKEELVGALTSFDVNGDNQLDLVEFLNGLSTTPQDVAKILFDHFANPSGYVPNTEYGSIYARMDIHNNNLDGQVSVHDFVHFVEKIVHAHH